VAAAGADAFLTRKFLERHDRHAKELAEPSLPLRGRDGRVGEARHVSCPSELQPVLLCLRAIGLLVRHVVLKDGVARRANLLQAE
jgi:hypothetical protein